MNQFASFFYFKHMITGRRAKWLLLATLAAFGLVLFARVPASHAVLPLATQHFTEIAIVLFLECAYVSAKSFAWMVAYNDAGVNLNWTASLKLFLISCFVDIVSFPTIVAGDGFKLVYLKSYGSAAVIRSIVTLRSGALLGYVLVASVMLSWSLESILLILISIFCLPALAAALLMRQKTEISWTASVQVLRQTILNSIPLSIDALRFLVLASIVGLTPSLHAAGYFIVSQLGGFLTGLPLGLGGREAVLALLLNKSLDVAQLSFVVIALRFTGELPSAFIGWLVAGKEVLEWRRNR